MRGRSQRGQQDQGGRQDWLAGPVRGMLALARFHPAAAGWFDHGPLGFRRSWWALPMALPFSLLCAALLNRLLAAQGEPLYALLPVAAADVAGWLLFSLVFVFLANFLGYRDRSLAALAMFNWFRLFWEMAPTPLYALAGGGLIDPQSFGLLMLLLVIYMAAAMTFLFRVSLGAGYLQAIALTCSALLWDIGAGQLLEPFVRG